MPLKSFNSATSLSGVVTMTNCLDVVRYPNPPEKDPPPPSPDPNTRARGESLTPQEKQEIRELHAEARRLEEERRRQGGNSAGAR